MRLRRLRRGAPPSGTDDARTYASREPRTAGATRRRDLNPIPHDRFCQLVDRALDGLPDELWERFENVAVVVEDEHPHEPDLLGVYEGVPLTERWEYSGVLPDHIAIFRLPLCAMCESEDELVEEVRVTVVHELAHHMGLDDEALHGLGWS